MSLIVTKNHNAKNPKITFIFFKKTNKQKTSYNPELLNGSACIDFILSIGHPNFKNIGISSFKKTTS